MSNFTIVKHAPKAPGLNLFGLGPGFRPSMGIKKIKKLLDRNSSWAKGRNLKEIKKMIQGSNIVVTVWYERDLVGFGRATTDGIFRGVLWDLVVEEKYQRNGIGSLILRSILDNKLLSRVEKIYVMTTHCENFYKNNYFESTNDQKLMCLYYEK